MTTPWNILPYELLQLIFNHLPTVDLIKYNIISSLYSSDTLIQQSLHNIWIKRSSIISIIYQLKNKSLLSFTNLTTPTKEELNSILKEAVKDGNLTWVELLISIGANNHVGMQTAAEAGYLDMVKYFVDKSSLDEDDFRIGMYSAAQCGHLDIVEYFSTKTNFIAIDWNFGMALAARCGNLELVEYFVAKGAYVWSLGMTWAEEKGNLDIVEYFKSKFVIL